MRGGGPNGRMAVVLAGLVLFVGAVTLLAVPSWFRSATGYGEPIETPIAETTAILEQKITVEFDASLERGMPWTFRPAQRAMELRIGETGLAYFQISNPTGRAVAGTASFSVAPESAGAFVTRTECFCFAGHVLQPGETVQLPVTFYVDPRILEGREAKSIRPITLSFTFFETELPETEKAQLVIKKGAADGA